MLAGTPFADGTPPIKSYAKDGEQRALWDVAFGPGSGGGDTGATPGDTPVQPRGRDRDSEPEARSLKPEARKNKKEPAEAGVSADPDSAPAQIQVIWDHGIQAARTYRPSASKWKLNASRRRSLQALVKEHPDRGELVFAEVVHGYRYARRSWEEIEQHFSPDTLLTSKRDGYLEALQLATDSGLNPPFERVKKPEPSGPRDLRGDVAIRTAERVLEMDI